MVNRASPCSAAPRSIASRLFGLRILSRLLVVSMLLAPLSAQSSTGESGAARWAITGLIGQQDDSRFLDILELQGGQWRSSYIAGFVLARGHENWQRGGLRWEGEVHLMRHRGDQSLWESNAAVNLRWTRFPWDDYLNTSVGFGQGISLASERPPIESDTRRLLHYMQVELELQPHWLGRTSVVTRLHHRSGAFGVYGTDGGSNFLTLGIRHRFQ